MMKERKKRTTIKEAYENGFKAGEKYNNDNILELLDVMLEDYQRCMFENPRNTKFTEIEMDAVRDAKEKIIYRKHNRV